MRIKLRHMEVLGALMEAGSVSRAAVRLNLSQPAVSIALSNLEEEVGFRLFHRDRGFFAPTNEATLLHEEVQQGLASVARIEQRALEIRSGTAGGISVATNGAMSINFLPRAIADFQSAHPGTFIELRVHSSRRIASWVSSRQIDIGLIDAPVPVAGLTTRMIRMECVCILHRDDPLAARKVITPGDLDGRQMVAITGDHAVDRQMEALMAQSDSRLDYATSAYFYAIARNMVAAGRFVSVIDPVNGKADLDDGVVWRPFRPQVVHELAMITARDRPLGLAAERFQALLRDRLAPHRIAKDEAVQNRA